MNTPLPFGQRPPEAFPDSAAGWRSDASAVGAQAAEAPTRRDTRRRRRKEPQVGRPGSERWLFSYADFVTLLFALFVVLFATSHHNQSELRRLSGAIHSGFQSMGARPVPEQSQSVLPAAELTRQLRSVLGDSFEKQEVSFQQASEGFAISFRELGFFSSGQANLLPGAAEKVIAVGEILRAHGYTLRVEGHSDDQPIHNATFHSNWELSAARAMTVLLLLVDQAQYDPTRISMAGYGPYRPVADNSTQDGRRRNRRVDLVIVKL